nr:amidase [Kibdelosporangium sp. MJ126-NF4]CEL18130.1 amidase [Kibdelosporangium sp. MJ126-NF4]CTQ90641.1 amidase [Kibdelosporangium sp. MJ126-NF4]
MNNDKPIIRRRGFLWLGAAVPLLTAVPGTADANADAGPESLVELGIEELRGRMVGGLLDARTLTAFHLRRIERMNLRGPALRAVIETNPGAMAEAERLDRERRAGRVRGPFHGIPVLVKDLFDTADRMHTTAGSLALLGSRPSHDSTAAARLRAAGAVLLGKANMSEWAGGMSLVGSGGLSARGGQGRNPYRLDRSPGDSSSGTGSAVAASLCTAGLGTETNGSILGPSSLNGVVGIKPTVGLTSRAGVIPGSPSMDSVGPIARSVTDAAIVLGVLAGPDPRDPATAAGGGHVHADYTRFLDPNGLRGARIGIPRTVYYGYSRHADAISERAIEVLRTAGAVIVDPADIPTAEQIENTDALATVQVYEVKNALNAYLRTTPGDHPPDLAGIIDFNIRNADRELRYFPQDALEAVQRMGGSLDDPVYQRALRTMRDLSRQQGIDAVLTQHRLDALVMPTEPPAGKIDLINGDTYLGGSSTPAALAGYPAITVPAGFADGLPVGITFMGTAWSEPTLIRLAYAYEQAARTRRPPTYQAGDPEH